MRKLKQKFVLSMIILLSLFVLGGNSVQAAEPFAYAGGPVTITTDDITTTIIIGKVTDADYSGFLKCAWRDEAGNWYTDIMDVGLETDWECPLDLSASLMPFVESGTYTLVLWGNDGSLPMTSDSMTLTIVDPNAAPFAEAGDPVNITTDQIATTIIIGEVTDADYSGFLKCAWRDEALNWHTDIMDVGPETNWQCPLFLSASLMPFVESGTYTLVLWGYDGSLPMSSDSTTLTIVDPNTAPSADAGDNVIITSEEIDLTIIPGTASDPAGDALEYRWMGEGEGNVLLDWTPVVNGESPLDLSTLPPGTFYLGLNTLTLEVYDGHETSSDNMFLTIENSAPNAAPIGGGTYDIYSDVTLYGQVSDYDGDSLNYKWIEGDVELFSSSISTPAGGNPVDLPIYTISTLGLGKHTITLQVYDGTNDLVSSEITVTIIDTNDPTLAPEADNSLLWPPNHEMVDIVIYANASDNSGEVTLSTTVTSNEPQDGLGDEDIGPDIIDLGIDQNTGRIDLQLRRERSGSGNGRTYTVSITATDNADNSSTATVEIIVPHDKRKK